MPNDVTTTDVVVRDGSTVCLRPVTAGDVEGVEQFLADEAAHQQPQGQARRVSY